VSVLRSTLSSDSGIALHRQGYIARVVIDEGHLVSDWKEFRTSYGLLKSLREVGGPFQGLQFVTMSATANRAMREEMKSLLGMNADTATVIVGDSDRRNCW
jgi:superfamily II DNA helicase RecQ